MCVHELASAQTRYDRETLRLIHITVCDGCGHELRKSEGQEYTPNFKPNPQLNKCD